MKQAYGDAKETGFVLIATRVYFMLLLWFSGPGGMRWHAGRGGGETGKVRGR